MAKERVAGTAPTGFSESPENQEDDDDQNSKPKKKKFRKKKCRRPKFCPNSSKSLNLSRSLLTPGQAETLITLQKNNAALQKNNEELAKALNSHKECIAELKAEKNELRLEVMGLREELVMLRGSGALISRLEQDYSERITTIRRSISSAIDNMVGLSENLTQGLNQTHAPIRRQQHLGASLARTSQHQFINRSLSQYGLGSPASGSKGPVSKVSPMVAGHAILRPRIQLTKMDDAAMVAALHRHQQQEGDQQEEEEEGIPQNLGEFDAEDDVELENNLENLTEENHISRRSSHLGRNAFNLTNIGEVTEIEDSRLEASRRVEPGLEEAGGTALETLGENSPFVSGSNVEASLRKVKRMSSSLMKTRRSLARGSLNLTPPGGARTSRSPERIVSPALSSRSPQVDILKTRRHPAVLLSPLVLGQQQTEGEAGERSNLPSLVLRQQQDNETPILPAPPSPDPSQEFLVEDFPENPSQSFLEGLCTSGLEGPSWLFNTTKDKKRRRSSQAVRKLSNVWSDQEKSSMERSNGRLLDSLDSSDIALGQSLEEDSSEVSGYVPAEKESNCTGEGSRRSSSFKKHSNTSLVKNSAKKFNKSASSPGDENDISGPVFKDPENALRFSTAESPGGLLTPELASPLRVLSDDGSLVRYNPRLDTGVTVAELREAKIQLNNVGSGGARHRLSECFINISPGRALSLDQVLDLGLQATARKRRLDGGTSRTPFKQSKRSNTMRSPNSSPDHHQPSTSTHASVPSPLAINSSSDPCEIMKDLQDTHDLGHHDSNSNNVNEGASTSNVLVDSGVSEDIGNHSESVVNGTQETNVIIEEKSVKKSKKSKSRKTIETVEEVPDKKSKRDRNRSNESTGKSKSAQFKSSPLNSSTEMSESDNSRTQDDSRSKRRASSLSVSYKEKPLNVKMRRI